MSDSITFSLDEIRLKKMKGSLRPPSNKRSVIKIPNKVRGRVGGRVERKRASESMEEFVRDKRSKEREKINFSRTKDQSFIIMLRLFSPLLLDTIVK